MAIVVIQVVERTAAKVVRNRGKTVVRVFKLLEEFVMLLGGPAQRLLKIADLSVLRRADGALFLGGVGHALEVERVHAEEMHRGQRECGRAPVAVDLLEDGRAGTHGLEFQTHVARVGVVALRLALVLGRHAGLLLQRAEQEGPHNRNWLGRRPREELQDDEWSHETLLGDAVQHDRELFLERALLRGEVHKGRGPQGRVDVAVAAARLDQLRVLAALHLKV